MGSFRLGKGLMLSGCKVEFESVWIGLLISGRCVAGSAALGFQPVKALDRRIKESSIRHAPHGARVSFQGARHQKKKEVKQRARMKIRVCSKGRGL